MYQTVLVCMVVVNGCGCLITFEDAATLASFDGICAHLLMHFFIHMNRCGCCEQNWKMASDSHGH